MTTQKPDPNSYSLLPSADHPPPPPSPNYVILQYYPYPNPWLRSLRRVLLLSLSLLLLSLIIYLVFPADPELRLVRVRLNHIRVHTFRHPPSLDLSLSLTLRVRNRDLFSLSYSSLAVAISYRDRQIGFVSSHGGDIRAKQSSYVNATLDLNGFEVMHDFIYLIQDVASGFVPFDTVSTVHGHLGLFFVKFPIEVKVSCEVDVNPINQKIIHQNCYPELQEEATPAAPSQLQEAASPSPN